MITITRTAASTTTEQVITGQRCALLLVLPEAETLGTITLRNGAAGGSDVRHLAALGVPQSGKLFGGAVFENGLTIQLSSASDRVSVIWEAL